MGLAKKSGIYVLMILFLVIIGKSVIPHSRVEEENIVLPDFSNSGGHDENHEEDGESLHSTFYQCSRFDYTVSPSFKIVAII